jgi:hypothetical protein
LPRSRRYKRDVWIAVIIVIAFIAVCETVLFFARRHLPLVAKLYGLGDLVKADEKTSNTAGDADGEPKARGESELP